MASSSHPHNVEVRTQTQGPVEPDTLKTGKIRETPYTLLEALEMDESHISRPRTKKLVRGTSCS